VCFVVHKTTSEQEHAILTSLYLASAKNTDTSLPNPNIIEPEVPLNLLSPRHHRSNSQSRKP
jgi:hypothetical protein